MAASANGVALDAEEDPNEAVAEETVAEEAQEDPQDAYVRTLTRYVTDMRVIHPDLVRAIAAYQALQYLGAALRGGSDVRRLRRLHLKSKVTEKIDEFWSHSWQLKPYRKIFCLLFLKNGLASSIAGTLGALLAAFLMRAGVLPIKVLPFSHIPFWCTVFGVIFSAAALFLWRPQAKVFLDVCCINQVDSKKKAEGIVSLGGILKRSKSLFILWDPSYIERTPKP